MKGQTGDGCQQNRIPEPRPGRTMRAFHSDSFRKSHMF